MLARNNHLLFAHLCRPQYLFQGSSIVHRLTDRGNCVPPSNSIRKRSVMWNLSHSCEVTGVGLSLVALPKLWSSVNSRYYSHQVLLRLKNFHRNCSFEGVTILSSTVVGRVSAPPPSPGGRGGLFLLFGKPPLGLGREESQGFSKFRGGG